MIEEAANLIAEFDAGAARVFAAQPFNRVALAEAFRGGFRAHSAYSEAVCKLVENIARLDQLNRQEA